MPAIFDDVMQREINKSYVRGFIGLHEHLPEVVDRPGVLAAEVIFVRIFSVKDVVPVFAEKLSRARVQTALIQPHKKLLVHGSDQRREQLSEQSYAFLAAFGTPTRAPCEPSACGGLGIVHEQRAPAVLSAKPEQLVIFVYHSPTHGIGADVQTDAVFPDIFFSHKR